MAREQLSGIQIPTLSKLNIDGEIALDAQSGTSGQVLISQGTGNTPAWTSTLTNINGLTSDTSGTNLAISTGARTGANTGNISLTTGAATTSGASGFIYIDSGAAAVGQINGIISIGSTPYALGNGNTDNIYIGNYNSTTRFYGTVDADLLDPLLLSVSTVGGGGSEGGQINFARVTDGLRYWNVDSFGSTTTPDLRFIEDATERFRMVAGGTLLVGSTLNLTTTGLSTVSSAGISGAITITTGITTSSTGGSNTTGSVTINTGNGSSSSAHSGSITIKTGNGSGSPGNSGGILIDSGSNSGGATSGSITIGTSNAPTITLGRSGSSISFQGTASIPFDTQPAITAISTAGANTLTIANILTEIITVTQTAAVTLTLPTGTLTDAGVQGGLSATRTSFDWFVINLGSTSGAVTMAAGTGHTYVGSTSVPISTSAGFRTVKTAANTYITYRIR